MPTKYLTTSIFIASLLSIGFFQHDAFATPFSLHYKAEITYLNPRLTAWNPKIDSADDFLIDINPGIVFSIFDAETQERLYRSGAGPLGVQIYNDIPDAATNDIIDMVVFFASDGFDDYRVDLKGPESLLDNTMMPEPQKFLEFTSGFAQQNNWDELPASILEGVFDPGEGRLATAPIPEPSTLLLIGSGLIGLIGLQKKRRAPKTPL